MNLLTLFRSAVRPKLTEKFELACSNVDFDVEEGAEGDIPKQSRGLTSISGLAFVIDYEAADGRISQRVVTCRSLSLRADRSYLNAYCHARRATRTFRVDRIREVFDPQSGESLGSPPVCFAAFDPDVKASSNLHWGLSPQSRADLVALLTVAIFVARCDEEYHPLESTAIEAIATRFWLRMELPGDPDIADIVRYADRLAPDGEIFWLSMRRLKAKPELIRLTREAVRIMIAADGMERKAEFYYANEIDEFFLE